MSVSPLIKNSDRSLSNKVDFTSDLLYDDAIYLILEKLALADLVRCGQVCRRWRRLSSHNYLWRPFLVKEFGPAPRVDVVCRDVYGLCVSSTQWEKKLVLATDQNVRAFVRSGPVLVYQGQDQLVCKKDPYSTKDVELISCDQKLSQIELVKNRLYFSGGSNAVKMCSIHRFDQEQVIAEHGICWVEGVDLTREKLISYSTDGKIYV